MCPDRWIQRTTTAGVLLLAFIAAVVSFRHMHQLCLRHGEDPLAAVLIPLAVDGAIVVASMSILLAGRYGSRGGLLAWGMLVVASLASLGANVAVAEPSLIGRIIAAWPSAALIGSYELLMMQIRRLAAMSGVIDAGGATTSGSTVVLAWPATNGVGTAPDVSGMVPDLRRIAWQWAQANRLPDGALPSGRAIAEQFRRSPRWGRWIKRAGLAGELR
ncbi:hypothetical protein C1I98_12360 [Spongiactinospora gelatinilytica]|uniref:DUF2637 domain-containing protein n=2 Tax=Spongiactinospora gelatinilytica TaxID=2666298 RepID=A0A2W2HGW0_9ACTN|nr:hypothetical protein C1I98_12360 [Spongiactinospora gelatinilytica]